MNSGFFNLLNVVSYLNQIGLKFNIIFVSGTFKNSVAPIIKFFGVFSLTEISKFFNVSTTRVLIIALPSRIPTQILGPSPKGRRTHRSRNSLTPPNSGLKRSGLNA